MKKETYANKLNQMLGIAEKVEERKTRATGKIVGITEDEIQELREAQGIYYFLQAPALFQSKVCKHCGEPYLVSRLYVAFCSYTCIRVSLNEQGIKWDKGDELEALILDPQVYNGNEPIWIRKNALKKLKEALSTLSTNYGDETSDSTLAPTTKLKSATSSSVSSTTTSETITPSLSSSAPTTTSLTSSPPPIPTKKEPTVTASVQSSRKNVRRVKRKFSK